MNLDGTSSKESEVSDQKDNKPTVPIQDQAKVHPQVKRQS